MIITVDIDSQNWEDIRTSIAIGLDYQLKLERIRKTRKGYHIFWRTHKVRVENIDFLKDTEFREVVRQRLELAEKTEIAKRGTKEDILRVILGDDWKRVAHDIKRKGYFPTQVLFNNYKKWTLPYLKRKEWWK